MIYASEHPGAGQYSKAANGYAEDIGLYAKSEGILVGGGAPTPHIPANYNLPISSGSRSSISGSAATARVMPNACAT